MSVLDVNRIFDVIEQEMAELERRILRKDEISADSFLQVVDAYMEQHPVEDSLDDSGFLEFMDLSDADLEVQLESLTAKMKVLPEKSAEWMDAEEQRQKIASELDRRYIAQYNLEGESPYPGAIVEQVHALEAKRAQAEDLAESRYAWAEMEAEEQGSWAGVDLTDDEW